jgi:hypothetical protein
MGSSKDIGSPLFKRVRAWFREKGIERGEPENMGEIQVSKNKARILREVSEGEQHLNWSVNLKESLLTQRRKHKYETMFQMR